MNKVLTIALIAGGLLLLESPEAAAHKEVHNEHRPQAAYHSGSYGRDSHRRDYRSRDYNRHGYYSRDYRGSKHKRARHMPRWLRHERSFRHWYEHSSLRRNRYIAWHVLFDIYRAEHRHQRHYRH